MTAIPTDTYPAHTIITEGYTQAPTPAPVAPTKAQQDFAAMDLQSLADAIQTKTGTTFSTGAELAAEQAEAEEEAKREARAEEEAKLDDATCGEVRSAIAAGDWKLALIETAEIWSPELKACHLRAITRYFKLAACPCCGGAGHLPGGPEGDAECDLCEELGLVTREQADGFEDDLAVY